MQISEPTKSILANTIVWDNHACMPMRPGDESFLPQLERHRNAGVNMVVVNIYYDLFEPHLAFGMLATLRHWVQNHSSDYVLVDTVADIEQAKKDGKLAIAFDIEGCNAVAENPGMVELFYRLGVRWMLIAYNKNNKIGGGCLDDDCGLTDYGKTVIDEMERVGMLLCCCHTGYRTAREAIEYSTKPVMYSHANPLALCDHPRNIPDDLITACAETGGIININGVRRFLNNDISTENIVRNIDYLVNLVGPDHVGIGLDYVYDQEEYLAHVRARPDIFSGIFKEGDQLFVEPERFPDIAEALLKSGYKEAHVQGILGHNNLRVARQVWK